MVSENAKISIITATYNRAVYLPRLYQSILEQKYNHLEWIVVDDGSNDNTKEVIETLKKEDKIYIEYIKKENGGKHTAINKGIDKAESDLVLIVDSDDILAEDSLNKINNIWKDIREKEHIVGIGGIKSYLDKSIVGDKIPTHTYIDASMIDITYKYNILGDKSIIFRTGVLKENKFPEIKDEKFLTEAVIYNRITNDINKIRWINEVLMRVEYLDDGLTKKYDEIMSKNWKGTSLYYEELLKLNIDINIKNEIITEYLKYSYVNKEFISILKKYRSINIKYKLLGLKKGLILLIKIKVKKVLRR